MVRDTKDSTNRALILAGQVLRKEVSLDQGLVLANSEGLLKTLIANLNVLSNREAFRLVEAEDRVKTGKADLALKGQLPLWELPSDISGSNVERVVSSPEVESRMRDLEREIAKAKEAAGDLEQEIMFVQAIRSGLKPPSSPWVVGAVLMFFGLVIAGAILGSNRSVLAAAIVLVFFTLIAVMIATKESGRYTVQLRKLHEDDKRLREKMSVHEEAKEEFDRLIRELESQAESALSGLTESDRNRIRAMHPILYDPARWS